MPVIFKINYSFKYVDVMNFELTPASFLLILDPAFVDSPRYMYAVLSRFVHESATNRSYECIIYIKMTIYVFLMQWKIVIVTISVLFFANKMTQLI